MLNPNLTLSEIGIVYFPVENRDLPLLFINMVFGKLI